jgi:hypothetical protein
VELEEWHRWWNANGSYALRAILLRDWDPISVGDEPRAQDEYDGYLGPLGSLLRRGGGEKAVAEYLSSCEERMGFSTPAEKLAPVAEQIVGWYRTSMDAEATGN